MSQSDPPLPHRLDQVGGGLQPERTTLAWERTSIAMMGAGLVLARQGARSVHFTIGLIGVAQVVAGGLVLAWSLRNDQFVRNPDDPPGAVPQVGLARLVGLGSVVFTSAALVLGVWLVIEMGLGSSSG